MRGIIAVVILLVVVFFGVPLVSEGTTNACQALEKKTVSDTATNVAGSDTGVVHNVINSVGQAGATGDVASQTAATDHPDAPSPVTCTYEFWQKLI